MLLNLLLTFLETVYSALKIAITTVSLNSDNPLSQKVLKYADSRIAAVLAFHHSSEPNCYADGFLACLTGFFSCSGCITTGAAPATTPLSEQTWLRSLSLSTYIHSLLASSLQPHPPASQKGAASPGEKPAPSLSICAYPQLHPRHYRRSSSCRRRPHPCLRNAAFTSGAFLSCQLFAKP